MPPAAHFIAFGSRLPRVAVPTVAVPIVAVLIVAVPIVAVSTVPRYYLLPRFAVPTMPRQALARFSQLTCRWMS